LLNIDEKQRYAAIIKGGWKLIVGKLFGYLSEEAQNKFGYQNMLSPTVEK